MWKIFRQSDYNTYRSDSTMCGDDSHIINGLIFKNLNIL